MVRTALLECLDVDPDRDDVLTPDFDESPSRALCPRDPQRERINRVRDYGCVGVDTDTLPRSGSVVGHVTPCLDDQVFGGPRTDVHETKQPTPAGCLRRDAFDRHPGRWDYRPIDHPNSARHRHARRMEWNTNALVVARHQHSTPGPWLGRPFLTQDEGEGGGNERFRGH